MNVPDARRVVSTGLLGAARRLNNTNGTPSPGSEKLCPCAQRRGVLEGGGGKTRLKRLHVGDPRDLARPRLRHVRVAMAAAQQRRDHQHRHRVRDAQRWCWCSHFATPCSRRLRPTPDAVPRLWWLKSREAGGRERRAAGDGAKRRWLGRRSAPRWASGVTRAPYPRRPCAAPRARSRLYPSPPCSHSSL